jgi:hypothetical protein
MASAIVFLAFTYAIVNKPDIDGIGVFVLAFVFAMIYDIETIWGSKSK